MRPEPWRFIAAAALPIVNMIPLRFTPMTRSQSDRSIESRCWPPSTAKPGAEPMPALAKTTSTPPSASTTRSKSAWT